MAEFKAEDDEILIGDTMEQEITKEVIERLLNNDIDEQDAHKIIEKTSPESLKFELSNKTISRSKILTIFKKLVQKNR